MKSWTDIAPAAATELNLAERLDIDAPHNEMGERCPWPWDPQQLVGAPLGQYHCPYCGAMVVAGVPHIDYREKGPTLVLEAEHCGTAILLRCDNARSDLDAHETQMPCPLCGETVEYTVTAEAAR